MYSMYSLVQKTIKYTRKLKALYLRGNVLKPYILYMNCGIRGNLPSGYNAPSLQKRAPHALETLRHRIIRHRTIITNYGFAKSAVFGLFSGSFEG
jgi:hypothetical protein